MSDVFRFYDLEEARKKRDYLNSYTDKPYSVVCIAYVDEDEENMPDLAYGYNIIE